MSVGRESSSVPFGRSAGRDGRASEAAAAIAALAQNRQPGSRDARRQSGRGNTSSTAS